MIADLIRDAEKKMGISIDHLHHELGKLRTGQASLALLDDLKVDYYGTPTPLKQVATLGTPDSQTLTIQPWEASVLKEIEWDSNSLPPSYPPCYRNIHFRGIRTVRRDRYRK